MKRFRNGIFFGTVIRRGKGSHPENQRIEFDLTAALSGNGPKVAKFLDR